jgi:CheY-like chemotaxis protein
LAFSRRQRLETSIVDLNDFLVGAMPLFRDAAGPLVAVDLQLAETSGAVTIDRAQLELALVNLAANARDAMPKGGHIVVETRSISANAEHAHVPRGEWAVIVVADTGSGMPPDVVARAFEPFFTTKGVGAGTGLGLSMVYGLVKQLGGEVAVESEVGRGTSVLIYLQRTPLTALREPGKGRPSVAGTAIGTVLLVDDDAEVRAVMAAALKDAGHRVVEAGNALGAVDLFGDGRACDVAVVDYAMAGVTGADLIEEMRKRRPNFPTLLVTGFADAGELDRLPAQPILYKPFSPDQLVRRVAELLERATT